MYINLIFHVRSKEDKTKRDVSHGKWWKMMPSLLLTTQSQAKDKIQKSVATHTTYRH